MSRRITPTAALVLPSTADRATWLAERRNGIGASDLPKILDLQPQYGDAKTVWAEKLGLLTDVEASEPAEWGIWLEAAIADKWAKDHGWRVTRVGTIAHIGHHWRRASLDRRVYGCERGPCALQVKCRSAWKASEWADAGTIPEAVFAQVQWELAVSGFDHEHLAVLVGGNTLVDRVVDEDLAIQALCIDEATRVWECVQAEIEPYSPPKPSHVAFYERRYPEREGGVELGPDAKRYLDDYRVAALLGKDADADKDRAKAGLLGLLGAGEVGLLGGEPVFTYKATARRSTDMDRLQKDFPDAYAACVSAAGARRFTLTKESTSS